MVIDGSVQSRKGSEKSRQETGKKMPNSLSTGGSLDEVGGLVVGEGE